MAMMILPAPALILIGLALAATVWLIWRARQRGTSVALTLAGAMDGLCGLVVTIFMLGHTVANLLRPVMKVSYSPAGTRPEPNFKYDFQYFSLLLLGAVFLTLGINLIATARGLVRGEARAWRRALRTSLLLMTMAVAVAPLGPGGGLFAVFTALNLIGLALTRRRVLHHAAISGQELETRQTPLEPAEAWPQTSSTFHQVNQQTS
jgi:hypothetical protein